MLKIFPIDANATGVHFWSDYGQPRNGGRTHQGNDLFAAEGSVILAPDDGLLHFYVDPVGGPAFTLKGADASYYGAHLSAFEGSNDRHVATGERIGRVGHTGNAAGTPPHLHFEIHPGGGGAVDPYPYLIRAPRLPAPWSNFAYGATVVGLVSVAALAYHYRNRLPRLL